MDIVRIKIKQLAQSVVGNHSEGNKINLIEIRTPLTNYKQLPNNWALETKIFETYVFWTTKMVANPIAGISTGINNS